MTLGYKGRLLLDYELEIPLKHTAAQGKLVCEEAVDFWNRLKAWCEPLNAGKGHFETIDPTIRSFNSNNNGICERAKVKLGFRLPVDFPLEQFKSFLVEAGGTARLHFSGQRDGRADGQIECFGQGFSSVDSRSSRVSQV